MLTLTKQTNKTVHTLFLIFTHINNTYFTRDIIRILFPVHILSTLFFLIFHLSLLKHPKNPKSIHFCLKLFLRESARPHILYKSRVTDHNLTKKPGLPCGCGLYWRGKLLKVLYMFFSFFTI